MVVQSSELKTAGIFQEQTSRYGFIGRRSGPTGHTDLIDINA